AELVGQQASDLKIEAGRFGMNSRERKVAVVEPNDQGPGRPDALQPSIGIARRLQLLQLRFDAAVGHRVAEYLAGYRLLRLLFLLERLKIRHVVADHSVPDPASLDQLLDRRIDPPLQLDIVLAEGDSDVP